MYKIIIFFVIAFSFLLKAEQNDIQEVRLPQESLKIHPLVSPTDAGIQKQWQNFNDKYGKWNVLVDKHTLTPHRAFGSPIKIEAHEKINENNIIDASLKFLSNNEDILNIDINNLELVRKTLHNNRWYVTFRQIENNVEVLFSEVELRIFTNGNLAAFGVKYYNDIDISMKPQMTSQEAVQNVINNQKNKKMSLLSKPEDKTYIIPVLKGNSYNYKLAYKYRLSPEGSPNSYMTYLDANTGDIIWQRKTEHNFLSTIKTQGDIREVHPDQEFVNKAFPLQRVDINGKTHYTDKNGELLTELKEDDVLKFYFEGKYVNIEFDNSTTSVITDTVDSEGDYEISFTDENSNKWERFALYHLHFVRQWIMDVDASLTMFERSFDIKFFNDHPQVPGTNAFSSRTGDTIAFVNYKDSDMRLSQSPSVLYHEFGHSINTRFYIAQGKKRGMINSSVHEATADLTSSLIIDDPRVGAYVSASDPDRVIRNIDNQNKYPQDIQGDSHYNGLILAGAFWDLREETSVDYVADLSHKCRYGLPDDPDIGTAFSEWFLEALIADDDDGDLTNGTPNSDEIIPAFNKHNIGVNLVYGMNIAHNKLNDTEEYKKPFPLDVEFNANNIFSEKDADIWLKYSYDNFETVDSLLLESEDGKNYNAAIPSTGFAELISYKFSIIDENMDVYVEYPEYGTEPYLFLAGYEPSYNENFEVASGWTMGHEDDQQKSATFEIGKPEETSLSYPGGKIILQPEEDHTEGGDKCLVTTKETAEGFQALQSKTLSSGSTSAISPVISVDDMSSNILRFYYYSSQVAFMSPPNMNLEVLDIYVKSENSWVKIHTIADPGSFRWERALVPIPDEFEGSTDLQLRFTAKNNNTGLIFREFLIDDMEILAPQTLSSVKDQVDMSTDVYPNPFINSVNLKNIENVRKIEIFNSYGSLVKTINNAHSWNGSDKFGANASAGLYIMKVYRGSKIETYKVIKK